MRLDLLREALRVPKQVRLDLHRVDFIHQVPHALVDEIHEAGGENVAVNVK